MTGKATLVASQRDNNAGTLHEIYKIKSDADTNYVSTGELFFTDKMPWLQLPYNKEINKEKKKQLVRILLKSESQFYKPLNGVLDGFVVAYEFDEIPVSKGRWDSLAKYFLK
jgi:hypothetical protein